MTVKGDWSRVQDHAAYAANYLAIDWRRRIRLPLEKPYPVTITIGVPANDGRAVRSGKAEEGGCNEED